jgi:hypothetical protein
MNFSRNSPSLKEAVGYSIGVWVTWGPASQQHWGYVLHQLMHAFHHVATSRRR